MTKRRPARHVEVDPDLAARRREAARMMFGCEHPDRHHYMTEADANAGLAATAARAKAHHEPLAPREVRPCCQVGYVLWTV